MKQSVAGEELQRRFGRGRGDELYGNLGETGSLTKNLLILATIFDVHYTATGIGYRVHWCRPLAVSRRRRAG
jgi:hypothetical protein